MRQLEQSFFSRDTLTVAQELLGKVISVNGHLARIVETEAYTNDPASHGFRKTERSKIMYDTYGQVYIFFIYGMYHCLNFTTEKTGTPGAVLIRAVEVLNNHAALLEKHGKKKAAQLCSGPGKVCTVLGIDKSFHGSKVGENIKLIDDGFKGKIGKSPRIGISKAKELEWRFFVEGHESVSK